MKIIVLILSIATIFANCNNQIKTDANLKPNAQNINNKNDTTTLKKLTEQRKNSENVFMGANDLRLISIR